MQTPGCNRQESEGGDHKAALIQKKLKAKTLKLKWRSSNGDMNGKVEAGGSDEVYDDTVLCSSLPTASFSSLISRKRMRTLGKVAEQCDADDPPVPRKLRSAINKRVGRFVSTTSRHVKKKRHLSAISAQISVVDRETRFNGNSLFTEEEEVVADVLLSLSQISPISELTDNKVIVIADSASNNAASTSCSEGPTKEDDEIIILPSIADRQANQVACIDKQVEPSGSIPHVNQVNGTTDQPNNINPTLSENEQSHDLSLGIVVNLPSPSKDSSNNKYTVNSSNNSTKQQLKVQFGDRKSYPAQKQGSPLWLVNSSKSDSAPHEKEKTKYNSAEEIVPLVQTPQPHTPNGNLIKPSSSKLAARTNTISENSEVTAIGNHDKVSQVKDVGSSSTKKAWKRSITHVYVSHLIQMHLNMEKASQNQVKTEERQRAHVHQRSRQQKNSAQDEAMYAVQFDVRVPAQQAPNAICDMSAGRQKMMGGNFLSLPNSTPVPVPVPVPGPQHVHQYLHPPQMAAARGPTMPYTLQHLPYSRGNFAPAAALQQMPQLMSNLGYVVPRAGGHPVPASSPTAMAVKLQQLVPAQHQHHQQQQQQPAAMWQFHVPHQYHHHQHQQQGRADAAATATPAAAAAAWHNVDMSSSLRAMPVLAPPAMPLPPQMELFCAPYQGRGGGRQQLRLI